MWMRRRCECGGTRRNGPLQLSRRSSHLHFQSLQMRNRIWNARIVSRRSTWVSAAFAFCITAASAQAQLQATVILPGFRSPVRMDTIGRPSPVAAPAATVYSALARVFDRLKLEPDVRDSASLAVGKLKLQAL